MKTITSILILTVLHFACIGQTNLNVKDSIKYEYAFLYYNVNHLAVIYKDKPAIDLLKKINLKDSAANRSINNVLPFNWGYSATEYKYLFAGFEYMDKNEYELLSSNAWSGGEREYLYRRKK